MVNVGIVGYGYAGRCFHAYLVSLTEGLNLYAVASRSPERRAQAEKDYGVKTYETIDQLIADDNVHLVIIATPHHTHAELAIKAMNAGKHVVTDKIMCMNVKEADAMIEAARKNNVMLSVFHNRRWDWDFLTVKKIIEDGMIGKPYRFETAILRYGPPRGWRARKAEVGGILYDWGAHLVDQAMIFGNYQIDSVYCEVQDLGKWEGVDIGNFGRLVMRFKDGMIYEVQISNLAKVEKPRWLVFGDEGTIIKYGLDPQEGAMLKGDIDAAEEPPEHHARVWRKVNGEWKEIVVEPVKGSWKAYYQNISDVLNKGAELAVKPEECRKCMAVFDAATKSAETGQVVKVEL